MDALGVPWTAAGSGRGGRAESALRQACGGVVLRPPSLAASHSITAWNVNGRFSFLFSFNPNVLVPKLFH